MRNRYFQEMQREGIRYRKGLPVSDASVLHFGLHPPFSEGQSFAYKFWTIADRYNSNEIIVDDLPSEDEIDVMLNTFVQAGIEYLAVKMEHQDILQALRRHGCDIIGECRVFRQETQLYTGNLEIIKGIAIRINR